VIGVGKKVTDKFGINKFDEELELRGQLELTKWN